MPTWAPCRCWPPTRTATSSAGAHGLPQLVVKFTDGPHGGTQGLVEGNLAAPIATNGTVNGRGYTAVLVGSTFIDDMAHNAVPVQRFRHTARR